MNLWAELTSQQGVPCSWASLSCALNSPVSIEVTTCSSRADRLDSHERRRQLLGARLAPCHRHQRRPCGPNGDQRPQRPVLRRGRVLDLDTQGAPYDRALHVYLHHNGRRKPLGRSIWVPILARSRAFRQARRRGSSQGHLGVCHVGSICDCMSRIRVAATLTKTELTISRPDLNSSPWSQARLRAREECYPRLSTLPSTESSSSTWAVLSAWPSTRLTTTLPCLVPLPPERPEPLEVL